MRLLPANCLPPQLLPFCPATGDLYFHGSFNAISKGGLINSQVLAFQQQFHTPLLAVIASGFSETRSHFQVV